MTDYLDQEYHRKKAMKYKRKIELLNKQRGGMAEVVTSAAEQTAAAQGVTTTTQTATTIQPAGQPVSQQGTAVIQQGTATTTAAAGQPVPQLPAANSVLTQQLAPAGQQPAAAGQPAATGRQINTGTLFNLKTTKEYQAENKLEEMETTAHAYFTNGKFPNGSVYVGRDLSGNPLVFVNGGAYFRKTGKGNMIQVYIDPNFASSFSHFHGKTPFAIDIGDLEYRRVKGSDVIKSTHIDEEASKTAVFRSDAEEVKFLNIMNNLK